MNSGWKARLSLGAGSAVLFTALVVHLTIRDRSAHFSPLFYATPWPLLAALALGLMWFWRRHARLWVAFIHGLLALGCITGWLILDWEWHRPTEERADLRVVHWNTGRPEARFERVVQQLRALDADLITVAEPRPKEYGPVNPWRAAWPESTVTSLPGEMLCIVRGEVLSVDHGLLGAGCNASRLRVRIRGREIVLLQSDIYALPTYYRGTALRQLLEYARAAAPTPVLIMGDLNTPRSSIFFEPWRMELDNAFEHAGRGCGATWPSGIPVLSLDQIWSNRALRAVRCRHVNSWLSDHRAVIADYTFAR